MHNPSLSEIDSNESELFPRDSKKWERLLLEPVDSNLKPGRQRFLEELRKVLYPGSKSYEGFRGWAKKSLPIDEHTGERFPLGHANLTFLKYMNKKSMNSKSFSEKKKIPISNKSISH